MADDAAGGMRTVAAAYAAFARGDLDGLLSLFSHQVVWDASEALWQRGVYSGHLGVRRYFAGLEQMWDGLRLEDYEIDLLGPGRFCVQGRLRGRNRATGTVADSPFTHCVDIDPEGKVARIQIVVHEETPPR